MELLCLVKGREICMDLFKTFYDICMWLITYIFKILGFADRVMNPFILKVFFQYLLLLWILKFFLAGVEWTIRSIRDGVLKHFYTKNIRNKSLKRIRVTSELYYLIDKFLFRISPNMLTVSFYSYNSLNKTDTYSPLKWYESIKSFILKRFSFSVDNILIWILIISYYDSNIIINVITFFSWDNIVSFFKNLDFKTINAIINFATFVLSFSILFLLRIPFLKAKAKRKIYDEKYEKAVNYQIENIAALVKCLVYSQENIDKLQKQVEHITANFLSEISQSNKYEIYKNQLVKDQLCWTSRPYKSEELFDPYISYNKELEKLEKNLSLINENLIGDVYGELNSPLFYEFTTLGISSTATIIGYHLLNREHLINFYNQRLKENKILIKTFSLIKQVEDGLLTKEKFLEKYTRSATYTYETIIEREEKKLEKAILEFRQELRGKLEASIYYYIVTREYVNKSSNRSKLTIKDWLFSK